MHPERGRRCYEPAVSRAAPDLPYTLRIHDTHSGATREVAVPGGALCGGVDLELFAEPPSVPGARRSVAVAAPVRE